MLNIRKISPEDNQALARVIELVLTEFRADPKTTMLGDPSRFTMYENYRTDGAVYFVAELDGEIVGGSGIGPLPGVSESICELQRMYLMPEARGKRIGHELLERCIEAARDFGYSAIYLETLANMSRAARLYAGFGFRPLKTPLGNTGHPGCNVWMLLDLHPDERSTNVPL